MTPGTYAYRFSGSTVDANGDPYALAGVGVLVLGADGSVSGQQNSSITKLDGFDAQLMYASYKIKGTYTGGAAGQIGQAELDFTSPQQNLRGTFDFVAAADDRMWLISTGAVLIGPNGLPIPGARPPDEVVSGEAVRVA